MKQPPNILWICTDQQRYDTIGALGNPRVQTPHLDGLIEQGVAFTHAYCQSPVCSPSRASFLTGRYPRTTRCRQNGQQIPADERLISRLLADAGYDCGLVGKLHLSSCAGGRVEQRIDDGYRVFEWSHHPQPDWPENAYSRWLAEQGQTWEELYQGPAPWGSRYVHHGVPTQYHQTTWCADRTIEFIRASSGGQPWMLSFNCYDPHHAFDPPAEYLAKYDPAEMPLPKFQPGELDTKPSYQKLDHIYAHNNPDEYHLAAMTDEDHRQVCAAYYAMVTLIDDQVGRMMAALEESGQRENTLVIFMSDHGELLGDHGIYLKGPHFYEESVRVPLVLSQPGRIQEGLRVDGLVALIDLAPTLLEAAGQPIPTRIQGRSLTRLLTGEHDPASWREHVFSEYYNAWTHHHSYGSMLRTRDHKVVLYHGTEDGELYDLHQDPDEFHNLWNEAGAASLRAELLERAFSASVFTMDPHPPRLGPF